MARRSGTQKGNPFERECAKRISLWWTQDDPVLDDNVFWRTVQSGGRSTTRVKAGKDGSLHCSDLHAINPIGDPLMKLVTIELKNGYNKANVHDLLDKPSRYKLQKYEEWIIKAERDRVRAGSIYWMLIHHRDRREAMVYFPEALAHNLNLGNCSATMFFTCYHDHVVTMPFSLFLQTVHPLQIKKLAHELSQ